MAKNNFPISRIEVADSLGRRHVLAIACNNNSHINQDGSISVATSIAMIDLDANTYKNENISK